MNKISIVCPVYPMKDKLGDRFLVEYLSALQYQTFKNFDIVISDQSPDDNLKVICDVFSNTLDIKYYKNLDGEKNAAANVNYGASKATGNIIKLLYVDDFFINTNALLKISNAFDSNPDKHWLINGFVQCNEDKSKYWDVRIPWYGNAYPNGDNCTGNPSAYSVRRESYVPMDEELLFIVDGEMFYHSYYLHGKPIIIEDCLVAFRNHSDSTFLKGDLNYLEKKERLYVEDKYRKLG